MATCFGQFQVNGEGMLQLEYVGLAPAEFSINDNGEVEATYATLNIRKGALHVERHL